MDQGQGDPGKHGVGLSALKTVTGDVFFLIAVEVPCLAAIETVSHIYRLSSDGTVFL